MRTLYIILDILFLACLCLATYNVVKFVWPRRKQGSSSYLIVVFYILVTIDCFLHAAVMSYLASLPDQNPYIYDHDHMRLFDRVQILASATALALGWLITATMYHLALSIKVIYRKMLSPIAQKRRKLFNIIATVMALIFFVLICLAPFYYRTD